MVARSCSGKAALEIGEMVSCAPSLDPDWMRHRKPIFLTPIPSVGRITNRYLPPDRRFVIELLARSSSTGYLLGASPRK